MYCAEPPWNCLPNTRLLPSGRTHPDFPCLNCSPPSSVLVLHNGRRLQARGTNESDPEIIWSKVCKRIISTSLGYHCALLTDRLDVHARHNISPPAPARFSSRPPPDPLAPKTSAVAQGQGHPSSTTRMDDSLARDVFLAFGYRHA
jgi:hypothetical protein